MTGIRLRHLAFTGPKSKPAKLEFVDGLNIIYGASNTGKSFALEALLFALGAVSKLPKTDEIRNYDAVWLGLTLCNEGDFTLYRATKGGRLKLFPGLITSHPTGKGESLSAKHSAKTKNSASHRILEALGLQDRWVVRNASGEKESLAFRLLAKFAVVGEEDIMSKRSPVYVSNIVTDRTLDQNVFKLILTGQDDAATVTVPNESTRLVAKAAKLELVDEILAQLDKELGTPLAAQAQVESQLSELEARGAVTTNELKFVQASLDDNAIKRRHMADHLQELTTRATELGITQARFTKLQAVYSSDLDRLHSIEESGFMLTAMARRECAICGAPPGAQKHDPASDEIAMAHMAAAVEARKIEREQRELTNVMESLDIDATDLAISIDLLKLEIDALDEWSQSARPKEASLRREFEAFNAQHIELRKLSDLYLQREKLATRREEIDSASTQSERDPLPVGPDATVLFEFGETVKSVLTKWGFPDAHKVQFDAKARDITVGEKSRDANGKGVRAVLHAAFSVAVAVYCIDKGLPHPGFLVLDTPLLTYREPLKSKHGDLSEDEKALKATSLAEKFYAHLATLEGALQVIVIENSDPPVVAEDLAHIEVFTGRVGDGRYGLFSHHMA